MTIDKQFERPMFKDFFIIQTSLLSSSASEEFRVFSFTRIYLFGIVNCLAPQLWSHVVSVGHLVHFESRMGNLDLKTFKTPGEREIFALSMICN